MLVVLTFPEFPAGVAYRAHVSQNFTDILEVLNGSVEDDNISNASVTASAKLKAGTITAALIAAGNIRHTHVDWTSANAGVAAWTSQGYAGANGSRLIRIEKTIALAAVTTEQSFDVDWSTGASPDGAVTFGTATPTISGLEILDASGLITGTDAVQYIKVSARSTTGCTVKIKFFDAPTAGNVVLMGMAAGAR